MQMNYRQMLLLIMVITLSVSMPCQAFGDNEKLEGSRQRVSNGRVVEFHGKAPWTRLMAKAAREYVTSRQIDREIVTYPEDYVDGVWAVGPGGKRWIPLTPPRTRLMLDAEKYGESIWEVLCSDQGGRMREVIGRIIVQQRPIVRERTVQREWQEEETREEYIEERYVEERRERTVERRYVCDHGYDWHECDICNPPRCVHGRIVPRCCICYPPPPPQPSFHFFIPGVTVHIR